MAHKQQQNNDDCDDVCVWEGWVVLVLIVCRTPTSTSHRHQAHEQSRRTVSQQHQHHTNIHILYENIRRIKYATRNQIQSHHLFQTAISIVDMWLDRNVQIDINICTYTEIISEANKWPKHTHSHTESITNRTANHITYTERNTKYAKWARRRHRRLFECTELEHVLHVRSIIAAPTIRIGSIIETHRPTRTNNSIMIFNSNWVLNKRIFNYYDLQQGEYDSETTTIRTHAEKKALHGITLNDWENNYTISIYTIFYLYTCWNTHTHIWIRPPPSYACNYNMI